MRSDLSGLPYRRRRPEQQPCVHCEPAIDTRIAEAARVSRVIAMTSEQAGLDSRVKPWLCLSRGDELESACLPACLVSKLGYLATATT